MSIKNFILILILFFFASCEKKEKAIELPAKGDGQVLQTDMGETYEFQYFVNLHEQRIVHVSKINTWHLAFQSGSNEHSIFLNGAVGMAAYNTGKTKFEDINSDDTIHAKSSWSYDSPTGFADSTAIGDWTNKNPIYLIRLNETGTKIRKLQITYEDAFQYIVLIGDMASTVPVEFTIIKNGTCNFTYFSFDKLTTVENVEPNKNSWDLQFTRYNYTFFDQTPFLRYIVTGVLLNPTNTSAYKDSLMDYNNVKIDFATSVPLSNNRDVIGFDWKTYGGAGGGSGTGWTIVKKYNYIIKDQYEHYFKLHFLDFYSSLGVPGSPKFEYYQFK